MNAELEKIDQLTREEICRLWRFAPTGHPWFQEGPLWDRLNARFRSLGGFSPGISKALGWDKPPKMNKSITIQIKE